MLYRIHEWRQMAVGLPSLIGVAEPHQAEDRCRLRWQP